MLMLTTLDVVRRRVGDQPVQAAQQLRERAAGARVEDLDRVQRRAGRHADGRAAVRAGPDDAADARAVAVVVLRRLAGRDAVDRVAGVDLGAAEREAGVHDRHADAGVPARRVVDKAADALDPGRLGLGLHGRRRRPGDGGLARREGAVALHEGDARPPPERRGLPSVICAAKPRRDRGRPRSAGPRRSC
jgi:hypothetical protein